MVAINLCIGAIALALLLRQAATKRAVTFWSSLPIFCGPAWGVLLTEHEMSMLFEHYIVPPSSRPPWSSGPRSGEAKESETDGADRKRQ